MQNIIINIQNICFLSIKTDSVDVCLRTVNVYGKKSQPVQQNVYPKKHAYNLRFHAHQKSARPHANNLLDISFHGVAEATVEKFP